MLRGHRRDERPPVGRGGVDGDLDDRHVQAPVLDDVVRSVSAASITAAIAMNAAAAMADHPAMASRTKMAGPGR